MKTLLSTKTAQRINIIIKVESNVKAEAMLSKFLSFWTLLRWSDIRHIIILVCIHKYAYDLFIYSIYCTQSNRSISNFRFVDDKNRK